MELKSKVTAVKEEKSYGHLTLNSGQFPFVNDLKIGEEKECMIKVKVKGLRQADKWEISNKEAKQGDIFASVNITGITMHKPAKAKGKEGEY